MLQTNVMDKPTNLNLYPKKKELERSIDDTEKQLAKKTKELKSLQQMVSTYKSNPKFGNSKHFAGEITSLQRDTGEYEQALGAMRANLAAIEDQLESLR